MTAERRRAGHQSPLVVHPSRRSAFVGIVLLAAAASLAGCGGTPPPPPASADPLERALTRGTDFLVARQDEDGAWRSDFYGPLKDGPSLTPLVLRALAVSSPDGGPPPATSARGKGLAYLAAMAHPNGTIDEGAIGLSQPVYTAALAVGLLSTAGDDYRPARDAWLKYLRERQLTEALGWKPADKAYGGWGYCAVVPRKPAPGEEGPPLLESNLSATTFALEALRAAQCPADDPALKAARVFVKRCQNYENPTGRDPAFDDGGFFFIYDDAVRNKAGEAGSAPFRQRFASYGSATADGLHCLLACGVPTEDARAASARHWLESHFDASTHPGEYVEEREASRDAVYYYYCRSLALDLSRLDVEEIDTSGGKVRWAEALAGELIKRQRPDGSWANDLLAQRENDPLIATSDAVEALSCCRRHIHSGAEKGK